jgi:hypothetical protein
MNLLKNFMKKKTRVTRLEREAWSDEVANNAHKYDVQLVYAHGIVYNITQVSTGRELYDVIRAHMLTNMQRENFGLAKHRAVALCARFCLYFQGRLVRDAEIALYEYGVRDGAIFTISFTPLAGGAQIQLPTYTHRRVIKSDDS